MRGEFPLENSIFVIIQITSIPKEPMADADEKSPG
jgi:hypothetical protein